jgi:CRISPR/Cas system Type II protein with McrA/HNH and RuvC-like nuclease domain
MNANHNLTPYLLGLDIGVQSIGWCLFDLNAQNEPFRLRRSGVRCFDSGVGSEKEIEMGKDESANADRRNARQQRRQAWRCVGEFPVRAQYSDYSFFFPPLPCLF